MPKEYGKANGFQPGSTFKTFVLAAAIEQGIPLNKTYNVPAEAFIPENEFETCDGPYQSSRHLERLELRLRSRTRSTSTPAPRAR